MNIYQYRELTKEQILEVLKTEEICSLGTSDNKIIEIVPMWYVFSYDNNNLVIYFIVMNDGTQMNNMKDTGMVGIEFEQYCQGFKTVVANGNATIITDANEKFNVMNKFLSKYGMEFRRAISFTKQAYYIKVEVSEITGRLYK